MPPSVSYLNELESEAIFIFREVAAKFRNPVLMYSVGKDSSVLLRLAQKAFFPGPIPMPLLHIDTGYKFPEMYAFRDEMARRAGARLIVERNEEWTAKGCHPATVGVEQCCQRLKTEALMQALAKHGFDAAIGGARRDEEKSRAKERVFSVRDRHGQWNPKAQRPEVWSLYNTELVQGQTMRVFPLSNWRERDVWHYIARERIPVVPLYFAHERDVIHRDGQILPVTEYNADTGIRSRQGVRFRSLGCTPCTGAVKSCARSVEEILEELSHARYSERENRVIDHTGEASMEEKKRRGYF